MTVSAAGVFVASSIAAARSMIEINARRSALKRRISERCGSELLEEKQYGGFRGFKVAVTSGLAKS